MPFISYAQNYEDVMLRRALKDVNEGFYIDVGANDPVEDSVTKSFYDLGWSGINIEPVNQWFEKLQQQRPNDTNLKLAAGARNSCANFYEVVGTGLSTMDKATAIRHATERGYVVEKHKVPVARLTSICEQHQVSEIHFLKIDVEGAELPVLQGLDLKRFRPWIILVESTLPNSQIENYEDWDQLLTDQGYHHVYFDGLNRFYVADEHDCLDKAFLVPPNYFDFFKRASEDAMNRYAEWLLNERDCLARNLDEMESQNQQLEVHIQDLRANERSMKCHAESLLNERDCLALKLEEMETQHKRLEVLMQNLEMESKLKDEELRAVYSSYSWLITIPMRNSKSAIRRLSDLPARTANWGMSFAKRATKWLVAKSVAFVLKRSAIKRLATATLRKHPNMKRKIRDLANSLSQMESVSKVVGAPEKKNLEGEYVSSERNLSELTPGAHRIHRELKAAIGQSQKVDL